MKVSIEEFHEILYALEAEWKANGGESKKWISEVRDYTAKDMAAALELNTCEAGDFLSERFKSYAPLDQALIMVSLEKYRLAQAGSKNTKRQEVILQLISKMGGRE